MVAAAVSRLRLRGPPRLRARALQQTEDALRLAPEVERLLLLRRLTLGRQPVRGLAAALAETAATRLRALAAAAVHGAAPGAAEAAAVWFASAEEARALLLLRLAAGEGVDAWYWRLAVPGWRGRSLGDWLQELYAEASRSAAAELALARSVARIARAGRIDRWVAAMRYAVTADPPRRQMAAACLRRPPTAPAGAEPPPEVPPDAPGELARLLSPVAPGDLRTLLKCIAAAPASSPVALWLARGLLLLARPGFAAQPALLAARATELAGLGVAQAILLQRTPSAPDPLPDAPRAAAAMPLRPEATPELRQVGSPDPSPASEAGADPAVTDPATAKATEAASAVAGALLLVNALDRLGFPLWLDQHPALQVEGFPAMLFAHIARRMRAPAADPLFDCLAAPEPEAACRDSLTLWRVGLDRWLRRRVRVRLAEIVCRRGWLNWTDEKISVRYPLRGADLRLRRRALDADPGWTPWLGRVVVYRFSDEPPP